MARLRDYIYFVPTIRLLDEMSGNRMACPVNGQVKVRLVDGSGNRMAGNRMPTVFQYDTSTFILHQ